MTQLISAKTFKKRLDCSLSQFYKMAKMDPDFPIPHLPDLFDKSRDKSDGENDRGRRWTEEQVEQYILIKHSRAHTMPVDEESPAPKFQRLKIRGGKIAA